MKKFMIRLFGAALCMTLCATPVMAHSRDGGSTDPNFTQKEVAILEPVLEIPAEPEDMLSPNYGPKLEEELVIIEGDTKELKIKKRGWKILNVTVTPGAVERKAGCFEALADKKAIQVTGLKSCKDGDLVVQIKAKKNGQKVTFTKVVKVNVITMDESIGTPIDILVADNGEDFLKLLEEYKSKWNITIAYISTETENLVIPEADYSNISIILSNPNNKQMNFAHFAGVTNK